jgi:hypothetical protein
MNSNGGSSFFGSDWLGAFLIIAILFGGGLGWGGGGRGPMPMPDVATKEFVQDAVNNQALQQGQKEILLSSANNNYETVQRLVNGLANGYGKVAQDVINGRYGNGAARVNALKAAGYDAQLVQDIVNGILLK